MPVLRSWTNTASFAAWRQPTARSTISPTCWTTCSTFREVTRGLVTIEKKRVDLKAVMSSAIEQAQPFIEQRKHTLHIRVASAHAQVDGEPVRLVQVLVNLLNNAAKFTPSGGEISASLDVADGNAILTVADNGDGIDAALAPRVFDLFTQAARSPDRSQGGLGLGLALVRSMVELHGGTVTLHSDGPGKGSRFTIQLPLAEARDTHADARPATAATAATCSLRVALVDDNKDATEVLGQLLEALGHQVIVRHEGQALLDLSSSLQDVDAFILDIGLPGMDVRL